MSVTKGAAPKRREAGERCGLQPPGRSEQCRWKHQPLLFESPGHGHGARGRSPDVGVVCAVHRKPDQPRPRLYVQKHWSDQGDVRQVCAAEERVVEHEHIAWIPAPGRNHLVHRKGHAAKVHRNVRRLSDQLALRVEQRTGIVEPFANVGREGRPLERAAHFIANRFHSAGKEAQFDGIGCRHRWPPQPPALRTAGCACRRQPLSPSILLTPTTARAQAPQLLRRLDRLRYIGQLTRWKRLRLLFFVPGPMDTP